MEQEKELTSQESLELITRMISRAKDDYRETGISALLWGSVITFCSLMVFFNVLFWKKEWMGYIWLLTFAAVIPQIIIARKERKERRVRGHHDDFMGGIWLSFAIAMFLMVWFDSRYGLNVGASIYMVIYGIPTFTTGFARKFRPMILGGIACWVLAIVSGFLAWPYPMLCTALAAQLAWFIPGLILRKRCLKVTKENV
ncbi:MAG TPA: hypothetical protein VNU72_00720 [Puia sp.]|nr:hypothetical protein [Puia sp.]